MSRKIIKAVSLNSFTGVIVDHQKFHSKKLYRVFGQLGDSLDDFMYTTVEFKDGGFRKHNFNSSTVKEPNPQKVLSKKTRDISETGASFIRNEQIENFRWLNSQIDVKLDMNEVEKIIMEAPIKVFYDDKKEFGPEGKVKGYTHKDGYVVFNIDSSISNDISSRILRFHEYIHLVQGKLKQKDDSIGEAINEAQTESLAQRRVNPHKSTATTFRYTNKNILAVFNFDAEHYAFAVCLLRQMEAIMGRKSYQKDFVSARDFSEQFINRYGIDLYTFITARMELIDCLIDNSFLQSEPYYIEDTQNKLMKEAFRIKFNKMKTIEDAIRILNMLRTLELNRIDLYEKAENGDVKHINQFEKLYNNSFKRIGSRLLKLGYSKSEIVAALSEYQYQEQEFYPLNPKEETDELIRINAANFINAFNEDHKNGEAPFNPIRHKMVYYSKNNGDKYVGVIDRNTKKLIQGYVWQDVISKFLGKEPEITEDIIDYLESDDAEEAQIPDIYNKSEETQESR